eukprot:8838368-Pyramimonas_sp.AAC.1
MTGSSFEYWLRISSHTSYLSHMPEHPSSVSFRSAVRGANDGAWVSAWEPFGRLRVDGRQSTAFQPHIDSWRTWPKRSQPQGSLSRGALARRDAVTRSCASRQA